MKGSLEPETVISHYRILTKLGAGGMGEVYLAEDTKLNRNVALKILLADVAANEDRMRRFVQEAKSASALNHPNIITIYEIDHVDSVYFIASEFIDGQTLREHMRNEPRKLGEALDLAVQISSALSAAHAAGIIHRDIKPDNIMLRRDGIVKVLDFGLAKLTERSPSELVDLDAPTRAVVKTDPGVVLGTAVYMSPEQARGLPVDERTDIFSLGVVLYEIMAGCLPFDGKNTTEVLAEIISEHEPPPLARYSREVPAELERIVSKALRKDRDERYQTIKDLVLDVRSLKQELEFEKKLAISKKSETFTAKLDQATTIAASTTSGIRRSPNVIELKRRNILIAAVLTLAAVIGVYLYFGRTRRGAIDSIAVLPLVNAINNPDTEYLSDGISESLINSLSQLPGVKVIASTSSFRYKGKEVDPREVARTLGVEAILTGRVSQRDDNLLINVELIRAEDKTQIWGEQYDRKATDLLSVQREIAREITSNLRLKLSGAEQGLVTKHYTENTEAYQLYLKGRFYLNKRTGDGTRKGIEYFKQALEKDPNYALGYAGLADAYFLLTTFGGTAPQESLPKSKEAAKRALELDESLAEAHASLASVLFFYDRNYPESDKEFRRAIELNPNYATAHHWYGVTYLAKMERFDEAISEMKRALELDPFSIIINADLGNTYINARQYEKAIEQLQKTIEMDQSFYFAHWQLGVAYEAIGSLHDASLEYQKARQLNDDPWVLALLGHLYAVSGKRAEALRTLEELREISKQRYVSAYSFAIVYAGLGDKDQAFQWLEKSLQDREPRINRIKVDTLIDNLHSDPRFAELVRRLGLPQ